MSDKNNHPAHGTARKQPADHKAKAYTYETAAPRLEEITGVPISVRQLKRWVESGKVTITKPGTRVYFTEAQLREAADSFVVKAVR